MAAKFEVLPAAGDDARILRVSGEVDMETSPALKEQILKALKGTRLLKVELRDVGYIDSSGIAVLITGHKEAQKAKVDFRLLDPSPPVRAVIELAMLQQMFKIESGGITR